MPYTGLPQDKWGATTRRLIDAHPLKAKEIVEVVLLCWDSIFESRITPQGFQIGTHIFPKPQIMGFFLHELVPLEFATRYPKHWRGEATASDKDLVFIPDNKFSVEIKTSSHASQIYGNRSYAQEASDGKKSKSGYYLAINFEKFVAGRTARPRIRRIRFGWLDHGDWIGQAAATGQQAHLDPFTEQNKLVLLHSV